MFHVGSVFDHVIRYPVDAARLIGNVHTGIYKR